MDDKRLYSQETDVLEEAVACAEEYSDENDVALIKTLRADSKSGGNEPQTLCENSNE